MCFKEESNFTLKSIKTEQIITQGGELKWSKIENQSKTRSKLVIFKIEYTVKRECTKESKLELKWIAIEFNLKRECETKLVDTRMGLWE